MTRRTLVARAAGVAPFDSSRLALTACRLSFRVDDKDAPNVIAKNQRLLLTHWQLERRARVEPLVPGRVLRAPDEDLVMIAVLLQRYILPFVSVQAASTTTSNEGKNEWEATARKLVASSTANERKTNEKLLCENSLHPQFVAVPAERLRNLKSKLNASKRLMAEMIAPICRGGVSSNRIPRMCEPGGTGARVAINPCSPEGSISMGAPSRVAVHPGKYRV